MPNPSIAITEPLLHEAGPISPSARLAAQLFLLISLGIVMHQGWKHSTVKRLPDITSMAQVRSWQSKQPVSALQQSELLKRSIRTKQGITCCSQEQPPLPKIYKNADMWLSGRGEDEITFERANHAGSFLQSLEHAEGWTEIADFELFKFPWRHELFVVADPLGSIWPGLGWCVWSSGEVLADYLAEHPELFHSKACLELGAGVGAVGMTMMKKGASLVVVTDVEDQVPLLERNLDENFRGNIPIHAMPLDWTVPEHRGSLEAYSKNWSVIVGADVGYDPYLVEPLLDTLITMCSQDTVVYLALADRADSEEDVEIEVAEFVDAARRNFDCHEVHHRRFEPLHSLTRVFRLTPIQSQAGVLEDPQRDGMMN
eukprot:gnl/MRDRNA2_/MRDRNA2_24097_c0_seq1.p1 gnl/MRDRNA2_/MRDRNA2_24097_c0~~gnl/MRDRNA2_/MRDRNA2_24097_c0_seq1.p1  ORF type:complete len:371 (-),score=61.22 gnl/MRDRNA2_/MRDRNA2_24097_c0_seq1:101-1213(-)